MDFSSNNLAFIDPSIGQYCQMLTNKNQMKNAIGEQNTSILVRWGVLMSSTALSRCGLPVSSPLYIIFIFYLLMFLEYSILFFLA